MIKKNHIQSICEMKKSRHKKDQGIENLDIYDIKKMIWTILTLFLVGSAFELGGGHYGLNGF